MTVVHHRNLESARVDRCMSRDQNRLKGSSHLHVIMVGGARADLLRKLTSKLIFGTGIGVG